MVGYKTASFSQKVRRGESGFSLLEVLVSLALISVTTLLISRTITDQFALSQRIEKTNHLTLEAWSHRQVFSETVGAVVPTWPESETDVSFKGTAKRFEGMTASPQLFQSNGLTSFRFSIENTDLVYVEGEARIVLATLPAEASFSYLGSDHSWYDQWPAETPIDFGQFDDSSEYEAPELPVAIRLQCLSGACIDWIRVLDWKSSNLVRRQDVLDF